MRVSSNNGLVGLASLLSLGVALALPTGAPAALLSIEVAKSPSSPLLKVETAPLPSVEVAGLPKVQVPSLPTVELPPAPPVQVPATPPVEVPTTPTVSSALPVQTSQSAPAGQATTNAGTGTGAQTASVGSTANTASTVGGRSSPAGRSGPARRSNAPSTESARARAAGASGGAPAGAGPATSTLAASSPAISHTTTGTSRKSASSNPLDTIGRQIPFPVPVPDWSKPIILLLLLLAAWFAGRARLVSVRARRLERQRALLAQDLNIAQETLAPAIPDRLGELEVSVAYRPADGPAAGGDFYDLFVLSPEKVAIILGDVVGHGHEALAAAALTRYTLRAYVQAGLEPRAALALAGSVLADPGQKHLATVVIAVHDSASGTLTYASAGHPPPIATGFQTPEPLSMCCSAPIACQLPTGRRQTTISLPVGGGMCFFSDGLLEAPTADGLLGRERLEDMLDELGPLAAGPALLERVEAAATATPDDMVACAIRTTTGPAVTAGTVEELEVDPEALEHPQVHRFLEACEVDQAQIGPALARARRIAETEGAALLRVERPSGRDASVAVLPGVAAARAAGGGATPAEAALALSTAR